MLAAAPPAAAVLAAAPPAAAVLAAAPLAAVLAAAPLAAVLAAAPLELYSVMLLAPMVLVFCERVYLHGNLHRQQRGCVQLHRLSSSRLGGGGKRESSD